MWRRFENTEAAKNLEEGVEIFDREVVGSLVSRDQVAVEGAHCKEYQDVGVKNGLLHTSTPVLNSLDFTGLGANVDDLVIAPRSFVRFAKLG